MWRGRFSQSRGDSQERVYERRERGVSGTWSYSAGARRERCTRSGGRFPRGGVAEDSGTRSVVRSVGTHHGTATFERGEGVRDVGSCRRNVNRDPKHADKGHAIKVSAKLLLTWLAEVLETGKTDRKTLEWKSKI